MSSGERILIVNRHRRVVGGVEAYVRRVASSLEDLGNEVALAYSDEVGAGAPLEISPAFRLGAAPSTEALRPLEAWRPSVVFSQAGDDPRWESALLGLAPGILFLHTYTGTCLTGAKAHAFPAPTPCARRFGPACLPLLYARRCGGLDPRTAVRLYSLQTKRRRLLGNYRAIVVASAHMRDELALHGVAPERVHVLGLPSPVAQPEPPPVRPRTDRVLYVGRLTRLKGIDLLVRAVADAGRILARRHTLTNAGEGPLQDEIARDARRLGVRAELVGWVDERARDELCRSADVLAVPSVWPEPYGLVGVEAAAVGLPAVAFPVGGIPEWLEDGVTGVLARGPRPSAHSFARALATALADTRELQRMRVAAWERARAADPLCHARGLDALVRRVAAGT